MCDPGLVWLAHRHRHRHQRGDIDNLAVLRPVCKGTSPTLPSDLQDTLQRALLLAHANPPDPVVVEIRVAGWLE